MEFNKFSQMGNLIQDNKIPSEKSTGENFIDLNVLSEEEIEELKQINPSEYYHLVAEQALEEERLYYERAEKKNIPNENDDDIDLIEATRMPKKEEDLSIVEIIERKEAAKKYHVLDEKSIYKGAYGQWRFIKDNSSVEEWDKLMSGNDNSELYNR